MTIEQIAMIGVAITLFAGQVISVFKSRGIDLAKMSTDISIIKSDVEERKGDHQKIIDLHDWHNHDDEDGVKIWYNRKDLREAIITLSRVLTKMDERDIRMEQKMDKFLEEVNRGD